MVKRLNDLSKIIHNIRGVPVMLDNDLTQMYGVEVKRLNEAVKRNIEKFPPEFMFQLTEDENYFLRCQIGTSNLEYDEKTDQFVLRSQIATSKEKRGGRRYMPYVFTEHGVVMLASVLNSSAAKTQNRL